ncbi:MAG TPA: DUF5320 domain-containing protein [Synergistales bacterium]|nr:DUF5320 domain-containing protein [Synergistaceae bacterium]HOO87554.1 DUF5320 domain-containing protein [Synergistales bacterium]
MPGRNGTGPMGQGSMTGWGRGPCGRGVAAGGRFFRGRGCFGWGMRMGMGMGRGGVWAEPYTGADEQTLLEQELAMTEARAQELRARLGKGGDAE